MYDLGVNNVLSIHPKSANAKIGPMPASNSARATCPPSCPLIGKGGCYADAGFHTRLNWDKLDPGERGAQWPQFVANIAALKPGTVWRHNVSGDLPPIAPDEINEHAVVDLVSANKGQARVYIYPLPNESKECAHCPNC